MRPVDQDDLEEGVRVLLDQGIIRGSQSPYGGPILLVPKKERPLEDVHRLPRSEVTGGEGKIPCTVHRHTSGQFRAN